jgi:methyl-accepting chemotaxis protein
MFMKLQTRILLPVLILIVLLALSLSVMYNMMMGSSIKNEFIKRGISAVRGIASNGRVGVLMQDSTQLISFIDVAMADREVRSIKYLGNDGSVIVSRGETIVNKSNKKDTSDQVSWSTIIDSQRQELIEFNAPVLARGSDNKLGMAEMQISLEGINAERNASLWWSLGLCLIFSIGAVVLLIYIIMKTLAPLKDLALKAEMIANGDLSVEFKAFSNDELGQLTDSFKIMVGNLHRIIGQVSEAGSAIASASSELTASTEEMAAGTKGQSEQTAYVSTAMEDMSKMIIENSTNAGVMNETATSAKDAAVHGGKVVEESILGMRRIATVVKASTETTRVLGASSSQIGQIVSVIDDIADQTNLLALNAAIEAARAGEQGRGFAVVADEVRKLAERTTKATKEIATMIKRIQNDTTDAISSMEQGTQEVDQGIQLVDAAGNSLREIVHLSQKVTDMVSQIAEANMRQAISSKDIAQSVGEISGVAHETAVGVEQIAKTAEDLDRLTENLQQLTNKFKLSSRKHDNMQQSPVTIMKVFSNRSTRLSNKESRLKHDILDKARR